jgi:hypothetical protein
VAPNPDAVLVSGRPIAAQARADPCLRGGLWGTGTGAPGLHGHYQSLPHGGGDGESVVTDGMDLRSSQDSLDLRLVPLERGRKELDGIAFR